MSPASPVQSDGPSGIEVEILPFVRMPIVDRDAQLVAYGICHQAGDDANLAQATLQLFGQSYLDQLAGNRLAFLEMDEELLRGHGADLGFGERVGPRMDVRLAACDDACALLTSMAERGVPVMIENLVWPDGAAEAVTQRLRELVRLARCVSIDVRGHDESSLVRALASLRAADRDVVATASYLYEPRTQRACMNLGFDAFQGSYLFKPAEERLVDTLKPNRLNLLRLLAAVQDPGNGPVELEELIRNDVVLSYKLLNCVNSAYFGLPRELKSLQQAAVYFGVTRIRNWIYSMALGDLDDTSPELLKQALLRARMAELLGRNLPPEQRDVAFITGLFSLLDTIVGAPMGRVLSDVPLPDPVRHALVDGSGPLATVLARIRAWESADAAVAGNADGHDAGLAEAYLQSLEWAEQVYSFAQRKAA
ncbi:MAG TPA: HDOD domain-containing protein [Rhodanobacteraceae bacterium]|nr:HDOD domain-containing protein [Rhodanobacteraceae bacterium]